jgi:hypothetical protein
METAVEVSERTGCLLLWTGIEKLILQYDDCASLFRVYIKE